MHYLLLTLTLFPALPLAKNDRTTQLPRVSVRYPPTIEPDEPWEAPPYAWTFGNSFVTYTSFAPYLELYNYQADIYPRFPTTQEAADLRQNLDLASYSGPPTGNSTLDSHVYTAFGLDTPAPEIGSAIYNFSGQGDWHLTNYYMHLAWGDDTNGDGYLVLYETPIAVDVDPTLSITSRSPTGPSNSTLHAIFNALNSTFKGETRGKLAELAGNLQKTKNDGRRDALGIAACDAACMDNAWMAALG